MPVRAKKKRKKLKPPKKRNLAAKQAHDQKAGPMKDKRGGRRGSKNVTRTSMEEAEQV